VRSELAVPVFNRGELWGVLNLESDRVDAYGADDLRLMRAVSVQLGRALACVWAFARLTEDGRSRAPTNWRPPCRRGSGVLARGRSRVAARRELGLAGEDLESLYLGGLFHNVGTVGVPATVLLKLEA